LVLVEISYQYSKTYCQYQYNIAILTTLVVVDNYAVMICRLNCTTNYVVASVYIYRLFISRYQSSGHLCIATTRTSTYIQRSMTTLHYCQTDGQTYVMILYGWTTSRDVVITRPVYITTAAVVRSCPPVTSRNVYLFRRQLLAVILSFLPRVAAWEARNSVRRPSGSCSQHTHPYNLFLFKRTCLLSYFRFGVILR